jgi:ribonuclease VapC
MAECVVDSSVLLAYLNAEPSVGDLEAALFGAVLSAVNFAEVVSKLKEMRRDVVEASELIATFRLTIHPADEGLAFRAGSLRAETRHLGLSLGDRFCLALGERLGLPILTADRAWGELARGFGIRVVR